MAKTANRSARRSVQGYSIQLNPMVLAAVKQAAVQQMHETKEEQVGETIGLKAARACLGDLVARVQHAGERITITRSGKPAAMLIPMDDWEILLQLMNRIDNEMADQISADPDASFAPYVPKRRRQA